MVEMPGKDRMIGYLGIGAGICAGYLLSGMFLKLSDRLKTALGGWFNKSTTHDVKSGDMTDWIAKLVAIAIWGSIAVWGYSKWKREDGPVAGFIMGIGVGGLMEEIVYSFMG